MKVVLVYDISTETKEGISRLNLVRKIAKKYLNHVQKSVFEGELTDATIERLKFELSSVINRNEDFVILYTFPSSVSIKREFLTNTADPTSNFI